MGVKALPRSTMVAVEAPEVFLQNGEKSGVVGAVDSSRVLEKQPSSRRKGLEKSVLDDIMGDPDDFQDLADCDLPSESDGGRWEDAVRAALEDEAAAGEVQQGAKELKELVAEKQESGQGVTGQLAVLTPCTQLGKRGPDTSHGPSSSGCEGIMRDGQSGLHQHADTGEDCKHLVNGETTKGAAKQRKSYHTRYFIIKSLNHHNIAKSIEKGIWATQAMNEPVLNEAYETSERVVLVFSVNMSSHFQGYARMSSPIGRRRANIWSEANEGANPWGGTFRVEWLRLHDLPFQKTVHLKNPLNAFKPVKISRDCQELTQAIGEALCALIDEGDDRDGRPKRKLGVGVLSSQVGKRSREDAGEGPQRLLMAAAPPAPPVAPPVAPILYPPHLPSSDKFQSRPVIRASAGFMSKSVRTASALRSSKSKSPHPPTSEKSGRERVRDRDKDRVLDKERTRSHSSSRSADLGVEEDLSNMTYEEYLQRHGHGHPRDYNGYHQGGNGQLGFQIGGPGYGGWTAGGPSAAYSHDDMYAKYVASWYCQAPSNGLHGVDHGYGYRPAEVGWHGHREDMGAVGYKRHGMG